MVSFPSVLNNPYFTRMRYTLLALIFILIAITSCKKPVETLEIPAIIPVPLTQELAAGSFTLSNATYLYYDERFEIAGSFLESYLSQGSRIRLSSRNSENNFIKFIYDDSIKNPEGYSLKVTPRGVMIKASDDRGAFYAVQTLRQLLDEHFENPNIITTYATIQAITITDAPRFAYRGMHLDVSRHMFPVSFIKKYIDHLAMLKMNSFHWHLTDDQGWRIEIKAFPKLQAIAAFREQTLVGHYNDEPEEYDCTPYGGYYTQEEVKEIVAYAATRHVEVIPEIEMPGHATAAIAAYPKLGCTGNEINVATTWGVFDDVFCPKEETFLFLETVLTEVAALFPGKYIHLGGDEVPKKQWKDCTHCQKIIKDNNLKNEGGLQNFFMNRMSCFANNLGKEIIGWDEIYTTNLEANVTIMNWRGEETAVRAAQNGHNVIMSPTSHAYFDYYQHDGEDEPLAIGGLLTLEKVYKFKPVPVQLNEQDLKNIIGVQGNLWTEYIKTPAQVEYMLFPRILAMSEVGWSQDSLKNYNSFVNRVTQMNQRLQQQGVQYANHIYTLTGTMQRSKNALRFKLRNNAPDKEIRYTIDGTVPTIKSALYAKPILVTKSTNLQALVFKDSIPAGALYNKEINMHKAVNATVKLNVGPNKAYNANGTGAYALINGISGSDKRYGDSEWLGFWGSDVFIELDLKKSNAVKTIDMRFFNAHGQWIYAPTVVRIFYDNETSFTTITIPASNELITPVTIPVNRDAQTIKINVLNYGKIPAGRQGAGNTAWTFIDEIKVK